MVVIGIETEFGFATTAADRTQQPTPSDICSLVEEQFANLPAEEGGVFLASGGRLYIDTGQHLEYATPEAPCPASLVTAVRAGEAILSQVLSGFPQTFLARSNHCHLAGTTYGSHENYSHQCSQAALNEFLIGHFTSRLVYTGAGGLDPMNPGIGFVLSPRAEHLRGGESSARRSICNTRREPHTDDGSARLHNISGDSQCFNRPLYLRVGATALLVELFEADRLSVDDLYMPVDLHEALKVFNNDPSLRATVPMTDGSRRTALDMQRQLQALAAEQVRTGAPAPPWASHVLDLWAKTLDGLASGDPMVAVDWVQKHRLFTDQIDRTGVTPDVIARWNHVVAQGMDGHDESDLWCARPGRILFDTVPCSIEPWPFDDNLTERLAALRRHLCKLDFFFAALPKGLFEPISQTIADDVPGVSADSISQAMTQAPDGTRAAVRSRWITRLHTQRRRRVRVQWCAITDAIRARVLAMPGPLSCGEGWTAMPHSRDMGAGIGLSGYYNRGDFRRLRGQLQSLLGAEPLDAARLESVLPYYVWCESRTGHSTLAERAIERASRLRSDEAARLYVSVYRFCALVPTRRIWRWIRRCEYAGRIGWDASSVVSYNENKAAAWRAGWMTLNSCCVRPFQSS